MERGVREGERMSGGCGVDGMDSTSDHSLF